MHEIKILDFKKKKNKKIIYLEQNALFSISIAFDISSFTWKEF